MRQETYEHSYPHCWRTDTPLIYKAVSSWFVQGDGGEGTHAGAEPGNKLGPGPRARRGLRQMAGRCPRLVDYPQPLLGRPGARLEKRRPEVPALDVYGSLDELEADFGVQARWISIARP